MISIFGKAFGKFVPDSNVAWAALCYEVHEKALRSPGGGGAFRWLPAVEGSIVFRGSTRLCRGTAVECEVCMARPQGLQERERGA